MPAGKTVVLPAASYARIRQLLMVQSGELTLSEGVERHVLRSGDCFGFGPPADVTFANETAEPCIYFVYLARS